MRYNHESILDWSWPGLRMTASGVAQQGTCKSYATAEHSENKKGGRQIKSRQEM